MKEAILGITVPKSADSHELRTFVKVVYRASGSKYSLAGKLLGVSPMVVWNLLNGRQQDSEKIRQHLGIHRLTAPAPTCADCGEVHVVGWCVEKDGEPQRPKPPSNRKRQQIRLAASVSEEERQALQNLANEHGLTWSEYCKELANRFIEDSEGVYF